MLLPEGVYETHCCVAQDLLTDTSAFHISFIGVGEIVLLPLDVLKIKRQSVCFTTQPWAVLISLHYVTRTNPEAFRGRGVMRIVADEGFALYRGWGWTAARNAPGSFAVGHLCNRHQVFSNKLLCVNSFSVVPPSQRNTCLVYKITALPLGVRTPLPL